MAASDPQGEMQFWFNGQPFAGVQKSGNDGGEMQFWFSGQPFPYLFPATGATGPVGLKTMNGVAKASIKPLGISIASIKSVDTIV